MDSRVMFTLSAKDKKALQVKLARHGIRQCDFFRSFIAAFLNRSGEASLVYRNDEQWDFSVRRRR